MARWMVIALVVLTTVAAVSSAYSAYKIYLMTDGKAVPTKGKR
jgi:hypothetical protein